MASFKDVNKPRTLYHLCLKNTKGYDISSFSKLPKEKEVLIEPVTWVEVVESTIFGGDHWLVKAEEVGSGLHTVICTSVRTAPMLNLASGSQGASATSSADSASEDSSPSSNSDDGDADYSTPSAGGAQKPKKGKEVCFSMCVLFCLGGEKFHWGGGGKGAPVTEAIVWPVFCPTVGCRICTAEVIHLTT